MDQQMKVLRVFIASPGDLTDERKAMREVIEEINAIYSKEADWRIELLGWEDTMPGAGRPQELINVDLRKADLFIGCLWQRWGSTSGNGSKTGFEEEFDLALERRDETGSPEMWMFFREVDPVRRNDPGEQLQKVLDFRSREIAQKRLLFREFGNVDDWRKKLFELFSRHLLKLALSRPPLEKEIQSTGISQREVAPKDDVTPPPHPEEAVDPSAKSLASVLHTATEKVRRGKLAVFGREDALDSAMTVRLLIFAASNYDWNSQHIHLGIHEINQAYLHKNTIELTSLERLFLIRTVLLDDTLLKPGWYWAHKWTLKNELWMAWFATMDSEEAMRRAIVDLATKAEIQIKKLLKKSNTVELLLSDSGISVRKATLQHLGLLGDLTDLAFIEKLLKDEDKDLRSLAERTHLAIRMRSNLDSTVNEIIKLSVSIEEDTAQFILLKASELSDPTLEAALTCHSEALRAIASSELLKRKKVTLPMIALMCSDDVKAVKECGWLARVHNGDAIATSDVQSALKNYEAFYLSKTPFWNKGDSNKVISAYFDRLGADQLWELAQILDENSRLAILAIGRRFFETNGEDLRKVMLDNFSGWLENAKRKYSASSYVQTLLGGNNQENALRTVRVAGLRVLAKRSEKRDRAIFLNFLSVDYTDFLQTETCLYGLSLTGTADDRLKIISFVSSAMPSIQVAATRAYLALSPSQVPAFMDLLSTATPHVIWVIVETALLRRDYSLFPLLKDLLVNKDQSIRRLVCYYAANALKRKQIEKELIAYKHRSSYFYNVVTIFDRLLYASPVFRKLFAREEKKFFDDFATGSSAPEIFG